MDQRIAELESQLRDAQAQAHAATINAEHAGQAMERRYTALAEDQGRLAAEKEKCVTEKSRLAEELRAAQADSSKLHAVVFEKDSLLHRKDVEVEALHLDKRALAKVLQQRETELEDLHTRLRQTLDKVVALSDTNAALDADAHEARAACSRLQQDKLKVEQQAEVLHSHKQWLEQELAGRTEAALQERRALSAQVMQLQQGFSDAENRVQELEASEARLKARVGDLERAEEAARQALKDAKDEADYREHNFQKELATSQKLAALYKEANDERSRKVTELEGVIRELQDHLKDAEAAQEECKATAEARIVAAEQEAAAERERCQRVLSAAANGHLPLLEGPGSTGGNTSGPAITPEGMSHTELYMKFVDATTQCRQEALAKRQMEITMELVLGEIEAKSVLVMEQNREYERVQAAHEQVSASLALATSECQMHIARINQLEAEARHEGKNRKVLEQQVKDLGQQVAVLVNQVHSLQGNAPSRLRPNGTPTPSSGMITADDIISERLVSFQDIQGLQQRNLELLTVVRQLGSEKEQGKMEAEQERAKEREVLLAEKQELHAERAKQQELFEQIVRQRDMFKKLYQDTTAGAAVQAAPAGVGRLLPAPPQPDTGASAQEGPDYKALLRDLEKEVERLRMDGEEHARLLSQDAAKAKEAASAARSEAARMRNEAEYESDRSLRLQEQLRDAHRQMDALTQSNTKYQVLVNELQQRVSNLDADIASSRDGARQLEARARSAESEKALLAAAEQRLARMVDDLSAEKHKLRAQLQVEQKASADKDAEYVEQRAHLNTEIARLQRDLSTLQKSTTEEARHLRLQAQEAQAAADRAENKATLAEDRMQQLREDAAQAAQRAASADVKVEVLQKAVQQAEERAAALEMQVHSRTGMVDNVEDGAGSTQMTSSAKEGDLKIQIKMLREELTSAQEAAAAATGHAKQYETLAKSSDEAVKAMQAQLEKAKSEYEERIAAVRTEAEQLQAQLLDTEKAKAELQRQLDAALKQAEDQRQQAVQLEGRMQAQLADKDKDISRLRLQLEQQHADIEGLRTQYRTAQQNYDRQVVEHAAAVHKMNALEIAVTSAEQKIREGANALAAAQRDKECAVTELGRERILLEQRAQAAENKLHDLQEQNRLLHNQLSTLAEQRAADEAGGATGSSGELTQVVQYLRKQQDILSAELQLAKQESARLRSDAAIARRAAEASNAQLAGQAERSRASARTEEAHAALMQKLEQLNLLRESNAALRADNQRLLDNLMQQRRQVEQAEAEAGPLRNELRELKATVEAHTEEIRVAQESAEQWEKRAQQLQQKYGKVDLAEHQRVQEALAAVQTELAQLRTAAEARQAQLQGELDQVRKEANLAKRHIAALNPEKLPPGTFKQKQGSMKKRLAELEAQASAAAEVANSMKSLQAELVELRKRLEDAEDGLREKQQEVEDMKAELKAKEQTQHLDKTRLQAALTLANGRVSTVESKRAAAEQRATQLLRDLEATKGKAAAAEKVAADCRAQLGNALPTQQAQAANDSSMAVAAAPALEQQEEDTMQQQVVEVELPASAPSTAVTMEAAPAALVATQEIPQDALQREDDAKPAVEPAIPSTEPLQLLHVRPQAARPAAGAVPDLDALRSQLLQQAKRGRSPPPPQVNLAVESTETQSAAEAAASFEASLMQQDEETAPVAEAAHMAPEEHGHRDEELEVFEEAADEEEKDPGAPTDEMEHDAGQGAVSEAPEDAKQDDEAHVGDVDEGAAGSDLEDLEVEDPAEQQEEASDGTPVLEGDAALATPHALPAPTSAGNTLFVEIDQTAAEPSVVDGDHPDADKPAAPKHFDNPGGHGQGDTEGGTAEAPSEQPPLKKPRLIEWKPPSASAPEAPQPVPRAPAGLSSLAPSATAAGRLPNSTSPGRPARGFGRGRIGARGRTARGSGLARGGGRRPPAQDGHPPPQADT